MQHMKTRIHHLRRTGTVPTALMALFISAATARGGDTAAPPPAAPPPAPNPASRQVFDADEAYRKAVDSVVWVIAYDRAWERSFGTGVVVDAQRGYILTAYHVVSSDRLVAAVFPERDAEGAVIGNARHYSTRIKLCAVESCDPKRDLAVLRLKEPMTSLKAMPLARRSASPGAALFTIGNDGPSGALWRYSGGSVRQVYDGRYVFSSGQQVEARLVEMTVPVNPGDSGGPIVNRYGELVGINSAMVRDENQVQKGIDVSEIRAFLQEIENRARAPKGGADK